MGPRRGTGTRERPPRVGARVPRHTEGLRMKRRCVVAAIALMSTSAAAQQPIAFTNVTVIDGRDSTPRANQTVVVRGARIVEAGPSSSTRTPAGARVIDGRGKFLIPGL